jgi:hypothetical protein
MLRFMSRRFAGSTGEALIIQGNWAQQAQYVNGYLQYRFILNIIVLSDTWSVAGELGFEPRQTESESVVLPLHHSPPNLLI